MKNSKKGITLIALIITIIVMLILVAVTINIALNGGLFDKAKIASNLTQKQVDHEMLLEAVIASLNATTGKVDPTELNTNATKNGFTVTGSSRYTCTSQKGNVFYVNEDGTITDEEPVPEVWVKAWTYNGSSWSTAYTDEADLPTSYNIIAKLYEIGSQTTPNPIEFGGQNISPGGTGDAYKFVLEGEGNMGNLIEYSNQGLPNQGYAWQEETISAFNEYMTTGKITNPPIVAYITEVEIGEGITNIGQGAFYFATSLTTVKTASTIETINNHAFGRCSKLSTINLPDYLTSIGDLSFTNTNFNTITLPSTLTTLGRECFERASSLTTINIKMPSPNSITISSDVSVFNTGVTSGTVNVPNDGVSTVSDWREALNIPNYYEIVIVSN